MNVLMQTTVPMTVWRNQVASSFSPTLAMASLTVGHAEAGNVIGDTSIGICVSRYMLRDIDLLPEKWAIFSVIFQSRALYTVVLSGYKFCGIYLC